jgi:hypothetical protein
MLRLSCLKRDIAERMEERKTRSVSECSREMSKQDIEQDVIAEDAATALNELIQQRGVAPVTDLDELSDLWPGDDDPDRLMRYVLEERTERRLLPAKGEHVQ